MLLFIDGFNRIGFRKYFLICIKNIILSDQLWGGFLFRSLVWLKTKQIRGRTFPSRLPVKFTPDSVWYFPRAFASCSCESL